MTEEGVPSFTPIHHYLLQIQRKLLYAKMIDQVAMNNVVINWIVPASNSSIVGGGGRSGVAVGNFPNSSSTVLEGPTPRQSRRMRMEEAPFEFKASIPLDVIDNPTWVDMINQYKSSGKRSKKRVALRNKR